MKILIPILLLMACKSLSAQYLHYEDRSQIKRPATPAEPVSAPITPAKEAVPTTISKVSVPLKGNIVAPPIVPGSIHDLIIPVIDSKFLYHEWPDKCPGMPGKIPVLNNYVPPIMVLKLTEIYHGYLFTITSVKVAGGGLQYKLQVCANGVMRQDLADEHGNIIMK